MADNELFGNSEQLEASHEKDHVVDPNKMVGDLISRTAVIDELEERLRANGYSNVALVSELNRCIGYIMRLPPAQPVAKDINVPVKDCISRQAAVSGISDLLMLELKGERLPTYNEVYRAIYDLPSAQQWIPCSECKKRCEKWEQKGR